MGRKKKIVLKKCETCGNDFNPGKHKEKKNCSPECLKIYKEKHKEDRIKKSKDAIKKKYGVNHVSEIPGWFDKVKQTKKEKYGDENYNNREGAKKTTLEKYGVENTMQTKQSKNKTKKTKKERYGDENYNNRKKAKKTIKEKYNVDHHLQSKESLEKMKKTNLERYDTEFAVNTEKAIENLKKYNQEKYDCDWFFESEKHILNQKESKIISLQKLLNEGNLSFDFNEYEKLRNKKENGSLEYVKYTVECRTCGNIFKSRLINEIPICRKCYPINGTSKLNEEFRDFLNNNKIDFIENDRTQIKPLELDFYIPSKNLAIEINGNYYHSELGGNKNRKYHINKTELCEKANIKLIHIFEDEWLIKKDIVKSRILNSLMLTSKKIYARKCEIKEVGSKDKKSFLEKNHMQGNSSDSIRYGLYYNKILVSLITFSKKRLITGHKNVTSEEFELVRFCSILNTNVIGAFEKLLKHFKKNNEYTSIISYADCRWSGINPKNTIYFKSGFNFINKTSCSFFYINKKDYIKRIHRFNLTKQNLLKKFGGKKNNTGWELAQQNNYDRIWDCGTLKFELK